MKTVINKNGDFVCTFEGGDINLDEPQFKDCTIIEGDEMLTKIKKEVYEKNRLEREQIKRESEKIEQEKEKKHQDKIDELEAKILKLEKIVDKLS